MPHTDESDLRPRLWERPIVAVWVLVILFGWMLACPACAQDSSEIERMANEAINQAQAGQFERALPLATRALEQAEKLLGPRHPVTGTALYALCKVRSGLKQNPEALRLAERALPILEKAPAPQRALLPSLLGLQGSLHLLSGDGQRARVALERAVAIKQGNRGAEDSETALWLLMLGELQQRAGNYDDALVLLKRALVMHEKVVGTDNPMYAFTLVTIARVYTLKEQHAKATSLLEQAVTVFTKTQGLDYPTTLFAMNQLAFSCSAVGDHARSASLLTTLLDTRLKTVGEDDPQALAELSLLAYQFSCLGDRRAEKAYQRVILICDRKWGPDNRESARNLAGLAHYYTTCNSYRRASAIQQTVVSIWQKRDPNGLDLAGALSSLASSCYKLGDYASAEQHARRALDLYSGRVAQLDGATPEQRAHAAEAALAFATLAGVYALRGDLTRSRPLLESSLAISSKLFVPLSPVVVSSVALLAQTLRISDLPRARRLLETTATLLEGRNEVGPGLTAAIYSELASVYWFANDYKAAQKWALAAASLVDKAPSSDPSGIAAAFSASLVLLNTSDFRRGIPLLQRCIESIERVSGKESTLVAAPLEMLGTAFVCVDRRAEALQCQSRCATLRDQLLEQLFSFSTPDERLTVQDTLVSYVVLASLGEAPSIAASVLRHKGLVLDASLLERELLRRGSSEQRPRIERLRALRSRLRPAGSFATSAPEPLSSQERASLEKQADELERSITREFGERWSLSSSLRVTVQSVQKALPRDAALVEFIRYRHVRSGGTCEGEERYGAAVILPSGSPAWVALGSADEIDDLVGKYRASMHRDKDDEATVAAVLRGLYDRVWKPVLPLLPASTQRVLVSPDDALNLVSFATLLGPDDRFVAEHLAVAYVASGRDILRPTRRSTNSEFAILADPTFSEAPPRGATQNRGGTRLPASTADSQLTFAPLPGTATEVDALTTLAGGAGLKCHVLRGRQATKGALAQLQSPRWLHLATHGFFLPGVSSATSGLALAGAQATIEAWRRGEQVPVEDDGIVTSEEVAFLDLSGTELVVLSACDTGVGKVIPGEGVLGLKRAFVQAGARNLVITLWPVHDNSTAAFMRDFYGRLVAGESPASSLSAVQREWLCAVRKKDGLHRAVVAGGPFIVTTQGPP